MSLFTICLKTYVCCENRPTSVLLAGGMNCSITTKKQLKVSIEDRSQSGQLDLWTAEWWQRVILPSADTGVSIRDVKASRSARPRGQIMWPRPRPRPHNGWPRPRPHSVVASASCILASWPRIWTRLLAERFSDETKPCHDVRCLAGGTGIPEV